MKPQLTNALLVALVLLQGCAATPASGDRFNPPTDHCVRTRPGIAIDKGTGQARTVQECSMWYFGPTREQDTRFRRGGTAP